MRMKRFVLAALVAIWCFLPFVASAQREVRSPPTFQLAEPMQPDRSTIPEGAFITPLRVGNVVRTDGVLYSLEANAWVLSQHDAIQQYWIAEMNRRVNLTVAWGQHELTQQAIAFETDLQIARVHLDARQRELDALMAINNDLRQQARRSQRRGKLKLVFIVLGTGVVAGLAGYGVGRVVR